MLLKNVLRLQDFVLQLTHQQQKASLKMNTLETLSIYDDMIENLRSQKREQIENYISQFYKKIESTTMQFNTFELCIEENEYAFYLASESKSDTFYFNVASDFMNDDESVDFNTLYFVHCDDSDVIDDEVISFNFTFDLQTDVLQFQKIVFDKMTTLMINKVI
jgi:hypothetical protein